MVGGDQSPISVASSNGSPTRIPVTAGSMSERNSSKAPFSTRMRERAAVLPGVTEDGDGRRRGRFLQVGVGEDHVRGLAAQLEGDALYGACGPCHDALADLRGTRKGDLGDVRMLDEPLPDLAPGPTTTLTTPSGMPASRAMRSNARALSGVSSAGLRTSVLPAARAGAIFQLAMVSGKFQGR